MSLEARINELEMKLAYQDDVIDKLDAVVVDQQRMIDALQLTLQQLRKKVNVLGEASMISNQADQKPPHY